MTTASVIYRDEPLRRVSKTEFFSVIGPRDVHPRPVGEYPYTSIFEDQRTRKEVGRIVPDERGKIYFLAGGESGESPVIVAAADKSVVSS